MELKRQGGDGECGGSVLQPKGKKAAGGSTEEHRKGDRVLLEMLSQPKYKADLLSTHL